MKSYTKGGLIGATISISFTLFIIISQIIPQYKSLLDNFLIFVSNISFGWLFLILITLLLPIIGTIIGSIFNITLKKK